MGDKRFRVQDLGLTEREAALLLEALGSGAAADLNVAADEVSPGVLAATLLFEVGCATGGLRPGAVGTKAEYEALAARIAAMDPRDALRVEGWVAGVADAAAGALGAGQSARRVAPVERVKATIH